MSYRKKKKLHRLWIWMCFICGINWKKNNIIGRSVAMPTMVSTYDCSKFFNCIIIKVNTNTRTLQSSIKIFSTKIFASFTLSCTAVIHIYCNYMQISKWKRYSILFNHTTFINFTETSLKFNRPKLILLMMKQKGFVRRFMHGCMFNNVMLMQKIAPTWKKAAQNSCKSEEEKSVTSASSN